MTDTPIFTPPFVTDLEDLFFEIGKLLALCKTPTEQKELLAKVLKHLEAEKELSKPNESLLDDDSVMKEQLNRHYQKGFARWGITEILEKETMITDALVAQEGAIVSFDEETQHHEKSPIRHSLMRAFRAGWIEQKKAEHDITML